MSSFPLRIAYFGLPLGALALTQAGYPPCLIGLGHPDAPGARRLRRGRAGGTLLLGKPDLTSLAVQRLVRAARPDVLLSWFWPKQVPESVLQLAPRGAFGVHPSLLPRWRGPDPYFWAIDQGDTETGVTLHRLARAYDTGPIIEQQRIDIERDDNAWTLAKKLDRPGLALLVSTARRLAAGEPLPGMPQNEAEATCAPQPTEALLDIDWRTSAQAVVRRVRALAPWPGALARFGDAWVEVLTARAYERSLPRALEPGEAVLSAQGVVIQTGSGGGVLLVRVRDEDGNLLHREQVAALFPEGLYELEAGAP